MTALGVYVGNDPSMLNKFSGWLGDTPDYVHGVVGYSNWKDYTSSANWQVNLWKPTGVDIQWSIPLISREGNLGTAASGAYNQYYKSVAETLLKGTPGDGPIMVRTGWEANGDWFFWNAIGKEEAFKGAFRQMSSTFKEVSDRFQFEWNINHANGGIDPASIYPGDEYVDVIGMDFYYKPEYQGNDPVAAFNRIVNEKYGLQWLENFAKQHNKPTAYSEWGVKGDNAGPFVQLAKEWFEKHNPVLQSYWDSDAAYPGKLSDGSDPRTGAAFKEAFRNSGDGEMTWADFGGKNSAPPPKPGNTPNIPTENGSGDATAGKPPGADDPVNEAPQAATAPSAPAPAPAPAPSTPAPAPAPQPAKGEAAASAAPTKSIKGTSAKETLTGTTGHDEITGGGGDTLKGGAGDDTYVITTGDVVVELGGQGIDTVKTWINNYVLPENVENLILTGTGWNTLTGNGLANRLEGNLNPNVLNGKGGNDILTGGGGNDTFVIAKGEGNDIVTDFRGGAGASDVLKLDGIAFKDFAALKAAASQSGADAVLNLGDGQTLTLKGVQLSSLAADDVQLVNIKAAPPVAAPPATSTPAPSTPAPSTPAPSTPAPSTPVVTAPEQAAPDAAPDAAPKMLPASATPAKWFYGSSKTETLTGTDGHDAFKSGGGNDTMKGGKGDDTYTVYTAGDKVVELAGQGIDTVETWLSSYTLPANVENLVVTGTSWTAATGNALDNRIIGNDSPNTLNGGAGNDVLTGGKGADKFVIGKGLGHDLITDFEGAGKSGGDTLVFQGFGKGASISHEGGNLFAIHAADGSDTCLTLQGVSGLASSDYMFS
ncbi:glycosyl hydrolase [Teichococcus rhizosphaerae]|nr:glycosyl hydrolase [Pseudoroseomonas rhizosphaerae]